MLGEPRLPPFSREVHISTLWVVEFSHFAKCLWMDPDCSPSFSSVHVLTP